MDGRAKSRTPSPEAASPVSPATAVPSVASLPREPPEDPSSRDRYGFRKANAYITREQYDAWDAGYTEYLSRRRKKWVSFLKDSSLMTENPNRFPPGTPRPRGLSAGHTAGLEGCRLVLLRERSCNLGQASRHVRPAAEASGPGAQGQREDPGR